MFSLVGIIILLTAVIGSSTLVAFAAWLIVRLQKLERGLPPHSEVPALSAQIEALKGELESLHGTVERLSERTDFTERLLESKTGDSAED